MIVTMAGHVDHGKTALVKTITGVDTDRLEEEKRRGLTIDLGFAYHELNGQRVGFVDVPGHHRFIHNMIAGVANMQHALLVIAANDGVMPQTKEHLNILHLLGLTQGTIALTKIDVVDHSQRLRISEQARKLTAGTFLDKCQIFETSTTTGEGVVQLQQHLADAAAKIRRTKQVRTTRIAIDRSFSPRGVGTVITGMIFNGKVRIGDELKVSGTGKSVRTRNLVVNGVPSENAEAGDRCGLQLSGETATNIVRGHWLRSPSNTQQFREFTLALTLLADFPRSLQSWTAVHIYHATSHSLGRLLPLENRLNPGDRGIVDVVTNDPLDIAIGDRLIVRDHDLQCTLGGGLVIEAGSSNSRRRHPTRVEYLNECIRSVEQDDPTNALCCESKYTPVRLDDFLKKWNIPSPSVLDLAGQDETRSLNGRYLSTKRYLHIRSLMEQSLAEFHRLTPNEPGASIGYITDKCKLDRETALFGLTGGAEDGIFRFQSGRYSLTSHAVDKATYNETLYEQILPLIDAVQPSTTGDIAKSLKIPLRLIESEMKRMSRAKLFVQVTPKRYFTQENLVSLAALATSLAQKHPFSVKEFRDASGIGRMPVIDVLEYFDRLRFTQRREDVRTVVGPVTLVSQRKDT